MTHLRGSPGLAGLLVLFLAAMARAQAVHVVAADGSGDFLTLQLAINAAANGDVILVRPAPTRYKFTTIDGKGLTIIGDGDVRPRLEDMRVKNLAAGQSVTLRFLDIEGHFNNSGFVPSQFPGLELQSDAGCVWLEDLVLAGTKGITFWGGSEAGFPGLVANQCPCIVVVNSEVRGGDGAQSVGGTSYPGGGAGRLTGSHLALYGSTFSGGKGEDASLSWPAPGGIGLDATASSVLASGSSILGGDTGTELQYPAQGPTSSGLVARDGCDVHYLDTGIEAGAGPGGQGAPIETTGAPSTIEALDGPHRAITISPALREFDAGQFGYAGQPGDLVLLLVSFDTGWTLAPGLAGALHVGPSLDLELYLAATGPTGTIDLLYFGPQLPAGFEAITAFAQPFVAEAAGPHHLGGPSSIAIITAAIPSP